LIQPYFVRLTKNIVMLTQQIALVRQSAQIEEKTFLAVSAALQKQLTRDFTPIWSVQATISPFMHPEEVPSGYWPVHIMDAIPAPGAEGYHTDEHHQPFALVRWSPSWSVTASHEMLEMVVDPFGDRLMTAPAPEITEAGQVNYLVEICDPCESDRYAYPINGIAVSDFYTPDYFDLYQKTGVRYSAAGHIQQPRQLLKEGYLSWMNPITLLWYQATWFGKKPEVHEISGRLAALNEPHRSRCNKFKRHLRTHHSSSFHLKNMAIK
jgi:hypothetical protein